MAGILAKAQADGENYWPGFVDALSTIAMVVTFLLIIMAVSVFAISQKIAEHPESALPDDAGANMPESSVISVAENNVNLDRLGQVAARPLEQNVLRLAFPGTTIDIDDAAKTQLASFLDKHKDGFKDKKLQIVSFYDEERAGYTKQRRIAYYRAMATRNQLLSNGYAPDDITVHVKEATTDDRKNTVEIYVVE